MKQYMKLTDDEYTLFHIWLACFWSNTAFTEPNGIVKGAFDCSTFVWISP